MSDQLRLGISAREQRRVSFTELAVFLRCGLEYYERFRRADSRGSSERGGTRLYAGQAVHAALARWFRERSQRDSQPQDVRWIFDDAWSRYPFPNSAETDVLQRSLAHALVRYVEAHAPRSAPVMVERTIKGRLGDFLLVGKVDRVDQIETGGLHIIDYKLEDYQTEAPGEMELQRDFYAVAFESDLKVVPERIIFSFVTTGECVSFPSNAAMIADAKVNIQRILDRMPQVESFEPSPNPLCRECGVSPSRCAYSGSFQRSGGA